MSISTKIAVAEPPSAQDLLIQQYRAEFLTIATISQDGNTATAGSSEIRRTGPGRWEYRKYGSLHDTPFNIPAEEIMAADDRAVKEAVARIAALERIYAETLGR